VVLSRVFVLIVLSLCVATPALAQRGGSRQGEQEVERLLDDARRAYDNLELDEADRALDEAVRAGERAGVRGRVMAEVHVQRGIIAHVRDKDKDRAVDEFRQALTLDRGVRIDSLVSTPSLEALFEQARRMVGPAESDGGAARRDPGITHKPVKRARANQIVTVQAKVSPELRDQMFRMYLDFRSESVREYRRVEMRDQGDNTFVARIGARFVKGTKLSYYILVEDRDGNQVAQFNDQREPVDVPIDDMATGDSLTGEGGDDEGADEEPAEDEAPRGKKRRIVTLSLSVGTGVGRITDKAEAQNRPGSTLQPGMAISPFHTLSELDFWVSRTLSIGMFGRIQVADFAPAGGLRVKFDVLQAGANHLLLRVGGGYGHISHQVPLDGYRDYTLEGPYFYTLGLTWALDFAKRWAFTVTPDFYHLIGPSPSQHVDISVGCAVSF
jgi:hypothetical protein